MDVLFRVIVFWFHVRCASGSDRCLGVPSPLVGEGQGGGCPRTPSSPLNPCLERWPVRSRRFKKARTGSGRRKNPPPCPSPTRGEGTLKLPTEQGQPM